MKAHDVVELAARNLRESVLRNSLTTIGIAVGVASLVAMLSLGIGLQQLANRRLTRSGLFNTVIVMPRDMDRGPAAPTSPMCPRVRSTMPPSPTSEGGARCRSQSRAALHGRSALRRQGQVHHGGRAAALGARPRSLRRHDRQVLLRALAPKR